MAGAKAQSLSFLCGPTKVGALIQGIAVLTPRLLERQPTKASNQGAREARYPVMATMSSIVSLVTTPFIMGAIEPFRAPVWKSMS